MERLLHIDETNELLRQIRAVCREPKQKLISNETKLKINEVIEKFTGYKDPITLSANLIFSSLMFTELPPLLKHPFYNVLKNCGYDTNISDYIEGIEFVRCDWKELYSKYQNDPGVVYIGDPPYLYTDKSGYSSDHWTLQDALEVLDIMKEDNFILYTSDKPGIITIINFLKNQGVPIHDYNTVHYDRGCCSRMNKGKSNGEHILYNFIEGGH